MLKNNFPIFLIALSALVLVVIWFKNGNIMGTGESGLPFYDFNLQYKTVDSAWFNYGLGGAVNVNFASSPTYYVFWQLQKLGIPNYLLQAAFFWICLFISGLFILKLTKEFFAELGNKYLILGVFFYWFNPISLVNVWNRFLNNYFIFFAFLPLALYLFVKGLKTKKFQYCFIFAVTSALFSYVHSSMAFNIFLWLVISYSALFFFIVSKNTKEKFFIVKYSLTYFFLWITINIWWIFQVFYYISSEAFTEVASNFFTLSGNFSSFSDLSFSLGRLTEIFTFRHSDFYNYSQLDWFKFYNNPFIKMLSLTITGLTITGILIGRKKIGVLFFSLLFLVSIFLIKGNNFPFGEILSYLFLKLTFFQLFRNPFEKFGFLLVLALTPLFVYSLYKFDTFKRKYNFSFLIVSLIIILVWGFPFWTGLIFTANFPPLNEPNIKYEVIVPEDYQQASDWLNSQGGNFRLVVFPLFGEGITYNWEKGFSGIDLTNQLLSVPSVSFDTTVPFYHEIASNIQQVFLENNEFYPMMNALNAKYILVREDIDWKQRSMMNPSVILERLKEKEKQGEFKKAATFGKLSLWENLHYKPSEISASLNKKIIIPQPKADDLNDISPGDFVVSEKSWKSVDTSKGIEKIYPHNRIITTEFDDKRYAPPHVFPHVSTFPENKKYPLILIKENIQEFSTRNPKDRIEFKQQLLGKRIKESVYLGKNHPRQLLFESLDRYIKTVNEYAFLYKDYTGGLLTSQKEEFQLKHAEIFFKHELLLKDLQVLLPETDKKAIESYIFKLKKILSDLEINPQNELIITQDFPLSTRLTYKYFVPEIGDYQLFIKDKNTLSNFVFNTDSAMNIQLNNQLQSVTPEWSKENYLYLGTFKLNKGENEISFNSLVSKNLVDAKDFDLKATQSESRKSLNLNNLITGRRYSVSFNYFIKKGNGPWVELYEDNSPLKKVGSVYKQVPEILTAIGPDYYDFSQKYYGFTTSNLNGAVSAELVFKLRPWNSCENTYLPRQEWCNDPQRTVSFYRQSEVEIKDLLVKQEFTEIPFLKKEVSESLRSAVPKITYSKINPTKYEVEIKDASEKYVLILSQLFDNNWALKTEDQQKIGKGPFLANVFANAWLINKPGDYKLIVEYEPQKRLELTSKISLAVLGLIVLSLLWSKQKILTRK